MLCFTEAATIYDTVCISYELGVSFIIGQYRYVFVEIEWVLVKREYSTGTRYDRA